MPPKRIFCDLLMQTLLFNCVDFVSCILKKFDDIPAGSAGDIRSIKKEASEEASGKCGISNGSRPVHIQIHLV